MSHAIGIIDLLFCVVAITGSYFGFDIGPKDPTEFDGVIWTLFFLIHSLSCALLIFAYMRENLSDNTFNSILIIWLVTSFIKIIVLLIFFLQHMVEKLIAIVVIWFFIYLCLSIFFCVRVWAILSSMEDVAGVSIGPAPSQMRPES